jgi:elongation factor Ts
MSSVDYQPKAAEVKALRDQTGAGMMDSKAALVEAGGDMDKAVEILRVKMGNKVGKLAGRETTEGTIQSYVHATGKVAAMVQVECNTDFVAKNEDFIAFARDVALHAVAANPLYVSEDDIPEEDKQREIRVFEQQLEAEGKPEHIRPKIIEGKLKAWYQQVVLLDQVHVNTDKHESKTIEQLRAELSSKTGENVVVKRFARFAIGE